MRRRSSAVSAVSAVSVRLTAAGRSRAEWLKLGVARPGLSTAGQGMWLEVGSDISSVNTLFT